MFKATRESLLWSGVYIALLLLVITPLNFIAIHFLMVPLVMLAVKLPPKSFALHYGITVLLVYLITGSFGVIILTISLFFLPASVVMGYFYKKKSPARIALTGGVVTLIGQLLAVLVIVSMYGININRVIENYVRNSIAQVPNVWKAEMTPDVVDQLIRMMTTWIPLYMIFISLWYIFITHGLGRKLLGKAGHPVPGLGPMKDWMLPKSLVWYYLIAMIMNMFVPADSESMMSTILWNIIPLLMLLFAVQAVSFLFFLADAKDWNRALPIAGLVLLPFLPNLLSLLGLFDVAFNLRSRINKQ